MGPYIALIFVSAQFLKYFEWSNMGIILAIKGADFLEASGLPIPVVLVLFIIMCALINMLIGGASTKWAILSPIFVPMFMFLGYHPALAQMAYRIGDPLQIRSVRPSPTSECFLPCHKNMTRMQDSVP